MRGFQYFVLGGEGILVEESLVLIIAEGILRIGWEGLLSKDAFDSPHHCRHYLCESFEFVIQTVELSY